VTIRFIGAVPHAQGAAITAALAPPLAQAAFRITLGAVAPFPPGGKPRGLWARIDEGAEELRALEREVSTRLHDGAGVPGESRAFTPHVTLARLHHPPRAARTIGTDRFAGGTMRVDAVTLFESRLSPKGAQYVPLQRTPLAHAAGDAG
jgi:2'-5' RNA ligase